MWLSVEIAEKQMAYSTNVTNCAVLLKF